MIKGGRTQLILAVAGVQLATLVQAIDGSIVNVALPQIQRDLGGSLARVGWTVTGYVLASLIAMPLAAALAARAGLRAYFVGSVILFTLASAACGLAPTPGALIAFRFVQGLGAGGLLPLSQGILMTLFQGERRGTAVALVGVAAALGPLIGPTIGGPLTDHLGWRWIFWINLPIGAVCVALLLSQLELAPRDRPQERLDLLGAGLLAAAVLLLQLACAHHPVLFPLALAMGVLFVWRERAAESPAVDLAVVRHPALAGTLLAAPLYGMGLYGSVFLAPLLLERELGLSASRAGLAVALGAVASSGLIFNARRLLGWFTPRTLCVVGAAGFAAAMCGHAALALRAGGDIYWPQALRGASTGLCYIGMQAFAFSGVPEADLATGASLFYLLRQLGGSVAIALVASSLDAFGTRGTVGAFLVLAATAPLSLWPILRARHA